MIKYIQLSGFIQNEGFYNTASEVLREAIVNTDKCVYISSKTDEFKANDERMQSISSWFKTINIEFKQVLVIDERVSKQDIKNELMNATCIYLMGGDTKRQMEFINQYEVDHILRNHEGIIVGLSAGAINMARLGLVESHVVPHYGNYKEEYIETEIMPLTYDKVLYGLNDNGVISHSTSEVLYYGDIFELKDGVARQISSGK